MARKRQPPRTVEVIRKTTVSPNMLRVTVGGPGLADFPEDQDGAYIKLRMTEPPPESEEKPLIRTYTVRGFDANTCELDIDFVLHDIDGLAADWARDCQPGDTIRMMGPGPKKLVDYTADWFLLVGDMSALPAIGANIEGMSDDARGVAILEIIDVADKQDIQFPKELEVHWIENPHPETANTLLLDAVKSLDWREGRPSVWIAGEFTTALAIRAYVKNEIGIGREQLYASSYWQIGQTEDGHRISKQNEKDS
jgi:NADPH-dependent ferric siderophore reductase